MITITNKESLFLSVYHTVWMLHNAKTARLVITLYRHITDKLLTSYRHITNCRLTVGRLSADCRPTDSLCFGEKWWNRESTLKCKSKCYVKPMKDPLGVSPSKGNQGTTRGKEKILFDLGGNRTHDLPIRSTVTLPTELRGRTEKVGDD